MNWHTRYGSSDEYEELRISVIEGDIPGEKSGYSVHVGSDPDAAIERFRKAGYEFDNDLLMLVSRVHRMNPSSSSKNLEMFKNAYRKFKTYYLIPVIISDDETKIKPIFELGIYKGKMLFRNVSDITDSDIDNAVFSPKNER